MNGVTFRYFSYSVHSYRRILGDNGFTLVDVHADRGNNTYTSGRNLSRRDECCSVKFCVSCFRADSIPSALTFLTDLHRFRVVSHPSRDLARNSTNLVPSSGRFNRP